MPVAFGQAILEVEEEGGQSGRLRRRADNCRVLTDGMTKLGFEPVLSHNLQVPIIVTFHPPLDANSDFEHFYKALCGRGYAIYPGELTQADPFRIGCISPDDLDGAVAAVAASGGTPAAGR